MQSSESVAALAKALAAAQGEIEGAVKDSANPHFRSKYADLSAVWDSWQAVGPKHGLSIVQAPGPFADGKLSLTTRLLHSSGEWLQETMQIPVTKADAQGCGSAITYGRRYALAAFAGIAPEDDDGEGAVGRGNTPRAAKPEPIAVDVEVAAVTEAMRDWAKQAIRAAESWNDEEAARAWANDKRNQKAMARLQEAAPELYEAVDKAVDERRAYLLARLANAA